MFCPVFLSGTVKTIFRVKRSFGVILAILRHFCKTEKARISFKKLARWHPMQKSYSRFHICGNLANSIIIYKLSLFLAKHNLNVNFEPIVYHDPNPISHRQRHEKSRKLIGYHHRPISQSNTVRVPSQLSSRRCELQELPKQFKYMPSALVDKCLQESIAKGKIEFYIKHCWPL